jgi:hypothetical protein
VAAVRCFAGGDAIPGCGHVVIATADRSVLELVLAHAARDQGLLRAPPALIELVAVTTHTVTTARRGHLRLVHTDTGR